MKNFILFTLCLLTFNCLAQIDCNPEFSYPEIGFCNNEGTISPIHDFGGQDGIYTYESDNGGALALDSLTGDIDLTLSDADKYQVTNFVETDSCALDYTAQTIEIRKDITPPLIEIDDFNITTNPWNCLGDFTMPDPIITDESESYIPFSLEGPEEITIVSPNTASNPSDQYVVFGAPLGESIFTFSATDPCGNVATKEIVVTVINSVLNVYPINSSIAYINFETEIKNIFAIDRAAVSPGCALSRVEISRETDACNVLGNTTFDNDGHPNDSDNDPDGGAYVSLCLQDINDVDDNGEQFGIVSLRIRGWSDTNRSGVINDSLDINQDGDFLDANEVDHYGDIWHSVEVRKHPLFNSFTCPEDITLNCDQDFTDQTIAGQIELPDSVSQSEISVTYNPTLNACNVGSVEASFYYEDILTCTQIITVENPFPPFDPTSVVMPNDTTYTNCLNLDFEPPTWTGGPCDFIGYTEDLDTFDFVSEGEFKIIRQVTVIDWCLYDETNGAEGLYTGSQEITIIDEATPTPFCVALSTVVSDQFPVTIYAIDFNVGSFDDCTSDSNLRFTFSDTQPNDDPYYISGFKSSSLDINAEDITDGQLNLDIYTWDEAGNSDFCTVSVMLVTSTDDIKKDILNNVNFPNPFYEETTLEFITDQANDLTISVFDVNGKVLTQFTKRYTNGTHTESLNLQKLPSGLLYYKIESEKSSVIGKMLKI